MAQLVFQGHETRGKELLKLLEHLGGVDCGYVKCGFITCYYYINREGYIEGSNAIPLSMEKCAIMTLEEFESQYPYKIGDKVLYHQTYAVINKMKWTGEEIEYVVECKKELWTTTIFYLEPYKEETMEETKEDLRVYNKLDFEYEPCANKVELVLGDNYEVIVEDGKTYVVRKKTKYPKTFVECAKILDCFCSAYIDGYKCELFEKLQELLICRDAYWKIACEQIGLGKPWEPKNPSKHYIFTIENNGGNIIKNAITDKWINRILVFPTEEMCDAFYENFKDLIEECKELL